MHRWLMAILGLLFVSALLVAGDKKNNSGQVSTLKFVVVKDDNNKPVRNAAVILHPVGGDGKQSRAALSLRPMRKAGPGAMASLMARCGCRSSPRVFRPLGRITPSTSPSRKWSSG